MSEGSKILFHKNNSAFLSKLRHDHVYLFNNKETQILHMASGKIEKLRKNAIQTNTNDALVVIKQGNFKQIRSLYLHKRTSN